MRWDECLTYKVKKVQKNPEQARLLLQLAQKRVESIKKRRDEEFPPFLLEFYYEAIKELLCALLAIHGYKSYSHECLLAFMEEFYPKTLDDVQIHFLDTLRMLRHDIQYRGREIADDYLERNRPLLEKIINILFETLEKELCKDKKNQK